MTQRATIIRHRAALAEDFGRNLFIKKFGEPLARELCALLGTYRNGPRKGKQRGYLHWRSCTIGGWWRGDGDLVGRVVRPGAFEYRLRLDRDDTSKLIALDPSDLGGPNDSIKTRNILDDAARVLSVEAKHDAA